MGSNRNNTISNTIRISKNLEIPLQEIEFTTSRSDGPGGQSVNKTETKVTLRWKVHSLPDFALQRLASKITNQNFIIIQSSKHRTQKQNKDAVVSKFVILLKQALVRPKKRKTPKFNPAANAERIKGKKIHSERKKLRQKIEY